jgi:hypothetical protein
MDDHHEQLVGDDQRDRRPRGHRRTHQAVPEAVGDVSREGRRVTQAVADCLKVLRPSRATAGRRKRRLGLRLHEGCRKRLPPTATRWGVPFLPRAAPYICGSKRECLARFHGYWMTHTGVPVCHRMGRTGQKG